MAVIHGNKSKYLIKNEKKASFLFWASFAFFILLSIAYLSLFFKYNENNWLTFFALIIFAGISIFLCLYGRKKAVKSKKFCHGRKGEEEIFNELHKLSNNYHLFQDIRFNSKSNIDFVVVGPTGIFAIEAKSHKGTIGFNGSELTFNGKQFQEKNVLKQIMEGALKTREYLTVNFVCPILVFSNKHTRVRFGFEKKNKVLVIGTRFLIKAIYKENQKLNHEEIEQISNHLEEVIKNEKFIQK